MTADFVSALLQRLASDEADSAWVEFLDAYAGDILRVARLVERDEDDAASAFLFACEKLAAEGYRRLRRFDPAGAAQFTTWLAVVVHNLCRDWRRSVHGRPRLRETIARLPELDRAVFETSYSRGVPATEALAMVRPRAPDATAADVQAAYYRLEAIHERHVSRRGAVRSTVTHTGGGDETGSVLAQLPDDSSGPEALLLASELRTLLRRSLTALEPDERLLLRLRFEHGLTLTETAHATGLKNAQAVDRRVRGVLQRLRSGLSKDLEWTAHRSRTDEER